jgi:uncharacterized protein YajQ (UPF0234 family)
VRDVLTGKLAKRGVDTRAFESGRMEPVSGNKLKEEIKIREGIEQDRAKSLVKLIKDSKLKVQASIQGDALRVSGAKKDTAAGGHRARAQERDRPAAAVQELPRLMRKS